MAKPLPAPRSDFIGIEDRIHLATGGEPPLLVAHRTAFEQFAKDKAGGMLGYANHWNVVDEVRCKLANLFNLSKSDIALIGNASEGIIKVLSSISWKPGDNVVVSELDYTSGRYAFGSLQNKGVQVRLAPSNDWRIQTSELQNLCDEKTRALYISQVNATTGQFIDITELSRHLEDTCTVLILDASHALGVVPVQGNLADFTVSSCYKFALGIHEGVFAWNQVRKSEFIPFGVGWASANPGNARHEYNIKDGAQRVEYGNSGHLGAYLLRESLDYLNSYGIEAISIHARAMCQLIIAGLKKHNLEIITPNASLDLAGNAAFVCSDPASVVNKAEADNILIWGDNGRIRISAHIFTTSADIEYFLDRLPTYL